MTPIERAQWRHVAQRLHAYADELVLDEMSKAGWYLLDLMDSVVTEHRAAYAPSGVRWELDA